MTKLTQERKPSTDRRKIMNVYGRLTFIISLFDYYLVVSNSSEVGQ